MLVTIFRVLGAIFSIGSGASVLSIVEYNTEPLVGMYFGSIFLVIGLLFLDLAEKRYQMIRDNKAKDYIGTLLPKKHKSDQVFFLFLRPFSLTNSFSVPNPKYVGSTFDYNPERICLEVFFTSSIITVGELCGLGIPGKQLGPGWIIEGPDDWREKVLLLMGHACGIFVIPFAKVSIPHLNDTIWDGTFWEIQNIIGKGLIPRTIFVMPPSCQPRITRETEIALGKKDHDRSMGKYDVCSVCEATQIFLYINSMEAIWEEVRSSIQDLGLEHPEYDERGSLYQYNHQGKIEKIRFFHPQHYKRSFIKSSDNMDLILEMVKELPPK